MDANGNTIDSPDQAAGSGRASDVYDFRNKLIQRSRAYGISINLSYNADGDRVRKSVTSALQPELYLVDRNNHTGYAQVVEIMDGNGTLTQRYHYGHDLVAMDSFAGASALAERSYYHYDGHGSVRALSSDDGVVQEQYDYDAFGILIEFRKQNESTGVMESKPVEDLALHTANRYLFAGEQWDAELGMYYNRARYLDVENGRFNAMDDWEGKRGNNVTLNKYLYGNGNAVTFVDPSGNFGLAGLTVGLGIQNSFRTHHTSVVSFAGDVALNTIIGVYLGHSVERILLNIAIGEVVGFAAGKAIGQLFKPYKHKKGAIYESSAFKADTITDSSRLLPAPRGSNPDLDGGPILGVELPAGFKFNQAVAPGQKTPRAYGAFSDIPDEAFVRNNLAVTPEFKPDVSGVRQVEVARPVRAQISIVGPQRHNGVDYPGGEVQVKVLEYDPVNPEKFLRFSGGETKF